MDQPPVIIVGAGIAGLCCARTLLAAGIPCTLLEAADTPGGRIRTDELDGFLLDRGFQVLLTAYPEAQRVLDYSALDLRPFEPGAIVRFDGRFHTLMDPWRRPGSILDGALARVGSLADKLRMGSMRSELQRAGPLAIYQRPETTILESLRARGFSDAMIDRFFRPFFGGITLDLSLSGSSRMMEFVFRTFSIGDAAVPAGGMQRIPEQLAAGLPAGCLRLNTPALTVEPHRVRTPAGTLQASAVVVATDGPAAARLLQRPRAPAVRGVTNLCFAIDGPPPVEQPVLILDGDGAGPVTNLAFMSSVSPRYAPPGKALASASVIGIPAEDNATLERSVRRQMASWFGPAADAWRLLRVYRIADALPRQSPPWLTQPIWNQRVAPRLWLAGDTQDTPGLDGAMVSGRRAAEGIIAERAS